jgi:hypothetical protein
MHHLGVSEHHKSLRNLQDAADNRCELCPFLFRSLNDYCHAPESASRRLLGRRETLSSLLSNSSPGIHRLPNYGAVFLDFYPLSLTEDFSNTKGERPVLICSSQVVILKVPLSTGTCSDQSSYTWSVNQVSCIFKDIMKLTSIRWYGPIQGLCPWESRREGPGLQSRERMDGRVCYQPSGLYVLKISWVSIAFSIPWLVRLRHDLQRYPLRMLLEQELQAY